MKRARVPAWLSASAAFACLPVLPAAAADEPRVLVSSHEWTLSSDAESCSIARQFGSPDDGVLFRLQTFAPGGNYRAILLGKPLPQRDSGLLQFQYSFKPDPGIIPVSGILNRPNGVPMVTFTTGLLTSTRAALDPADRPERSPAEIEARAAAVDTLMVQFSRGRPLALQLGSMADPLSRLTACSLELPGKWGLDPGVQRTLSRPAIPIDQANWLGPGSYPWNYLRNGQSLMVNLRTIMDERGTPTACIVQAPRTPSGAEQLACREIMKTARFEPALDGAGNPVPSYFATSIFFLTPRRNGPVSRGGTLVGGP